MSGEQSYHAGFACAELITEYERGTYVAEKDILFKDFLTTWITGYAQTVKISSVRVREHESRKLLDYFSNFKIKHITKKMYQDALYDLKSKGLSDNTISGIHTTERMLFAKAVEMNVIKSNPTQYAKLARVQKTIEELEQEDEAVKYLEKDELSCFLSAAKEKGLDQDLTISITKTYYNPKNNTLDYKLLPPKTKTSKRKIDMAPIVFEELKKHRAKQTELRMEYRKTYHDGNFIIAKTDPLLVGYPEQIKTLENRMRRLLKIAQLNETLTPHSLRHTHTSLLAEAGVGLHEIMERLGHKDDDTTRNVYMHVTKTMKKEASHKFSQLMQSL